MVQFAAPVQKGMEFAPPDLKSEGFPKKSQRSVLSLLMNAPLLSTPEEKLFWVSQTVHGCPLCSVMMALTFHPSSSWPWPFIDGRSEVVVSVNRWRMSKSPLE